MAHVKTKDRARLVMNLRAFGADDIYIAKKLECHVEELRTIYAEELQMGHMDAIAQVAQRLFTIATTGDARVATPAAIFWLKTQAGWAEPSKEKEAGKAVVNLNFQGREDLLDELARGLELQAQTATPEKVTKQ